MAILDGLKTTSKNSIAWFKDNISKLMNNRSMRNIKRSDLMKDTDYLTTRIEMGKMYLFNYDPKHKQTLPYYDTYPLTIPIERYNDGFLGLNLHYLPPKIRLTLLERLLELTTTKRLSERTRIRATYALLSSSTKYKFMKPTIKRYLNNHIRSQFVRINPEDWKIAIFLPYEGFKKASKQNVWKDSTRMIR